MPRLILCASLLLLASAAARAGYEQPCFIDGGQSADGRFVVTAQQTVKGKTVHGPHEWTFTWKDTQQDNSVTFPAQGIQKGQIYAHLFVAPDGATFALWNHVTLFWAENSFMHASQKLPPREEKDAWRRQEVFSGRLVIYRNDGSLVKSLAVADLLLPEEWETVLPVFNRVHWLVEYPGLKFKQTPRPGYAFFRLSPDHTIFEFQATPSRAARRMPPRVVRVSLADGRVLAADEKLTDPDKIPVRPYQGPDHLPDNEPVWKETYLPSLDGVRTPGRFAKAASN